MSVRIQHPGLFSTLQDRGRRGLRYLGIPWAGVGCEPWMRFANALLNQDRHTPVIETFEGGLSLQATNIPARLSLVGDVEAQITYADGSSTTINGWRTLNLMTGDRLTIKRTGRYRCALIGIKSLNIAPHFGSASTFAKAGLGGLNGHSLQAGDELPVDTVLAAGSEADVNMKPYQFPGETSHVTLKAVAGPQQDAFTEAALDMFFSEPYQITQDIDRMGARLDGPVLAHRSKEHRDIVSDAILPGSVQVPGVGTPIVMLADANTVGGYPKIATVVSADVALLSLCRPGTTVRFERVNTEQARRHTVAIDKAVGTHSTHVDAIVKTNFDSKQLLALNLIGGVTNPQDPSCQ